MLLIIVIIAVASAVSFAAGYALATARARARRALSTSPSASQSASSPPALPAPETAPPIDVSAVPEQEPARVVFSPLAAEGTAEWRLAMADLGDRMRSAGVRLVAFAHGSFVGDDPLAIARAVESAVPVLPDVARALRSFTRANVSRVLGDLSNFSGAYVRAFAEATGVDAIDFTWSGENHHAARVVGAARLARALALRGGGAFRGDRFLLLGHSHGGQLFPILSQLIARAHGYEDLIGAATALGEDAGALEEHLALLRRCAIDAATFGTPLRYGWARGAPFRSLHVVNHRGAAARAGSLRGLLHTGHGDYVHQLGTHGSDLPSLVAKHRAISAKLDPLLGKGTSLRAWLRHVARGLRVSPHGHTVLVDYGDRGRVLPNFWSTGFGHAAYTRRDGMLFHARLVVDHFYPAGPKAPWAMRARHDLARVPRS
jgi:hypothetical protein